MSMDLSENGVSPISWDYHHVPHKNANGGGIPQFETAISKMLCKLRLEQTK